MYQSNPFKDDDRSNIRDCLERFSFIDESLPKKTFIMTEYWL